MTGAFPSILLGARGQVGKSLRRLFQAEGERVWVSSRTPAEGEFFVDFEKPESIQRFFAAYSEAHPQAKTVVFLTGAFTHVDGCEQDPAKCKRINYDGALLVAEECARRGHHLVFFSSEYVFGNAEYAGGAIGPFSESDPVAPTSVYGQAKADVERALQAMAPGLSATIIRTTVVFSWEPTDMNFAMQLRRFLRERLASGVLEPKFRIPTDQVSTPTYAPALARAAIELGRRKSQGIFHIVGADLLSRADFARKLIERFGMELGAVEKFIEFLPTQELRQPARRPLRAGLCTEKAKASGLQIFGLAEAFQEYRPE